MPESLIETPHEGPLDELDFAARLRILEDQVRDIEVRVNEGKEGSGTALSIKEIWSGARLMDSATVTLAAADVSNLDTEFDYYLLITDLGVFGSDDLPDADAPILSVLDSNFNTEAYSWRQDAGAIIFTETDSGGTPHMTLKAIVGIKLA